MPSIFFWKRKRKQRSKKKDDKSTNTTTGDDAATQQPPPGDTSANNSALTEQAPPSVAQPTAEATYDVVTKGSSGNESDNTEPGYSVVSHNRTITSSQKGATALVNQQQSSVTAAADDDKLRDNASLHNDSHGVSDKEKSQSIFDVDPEQLYSKVVSKKERQERSVAQSQSEYSLLQHKKVGNVDDVSNPLPVCSPQLYSILDSPHRTVSTGCVTKHTSIDFTSPAAAEPRYTSSDSSYASSDEHYGSHQRHKPFQPIVYLPPRSSSERRHDRSGNKRSRRHHHNDSSKATNSHSASSDLLKKNEFLVQGTTLDGSVTLYAASPVGSPLPAEQAGPVLNRLSSRPSSRQEDHVTRSHMEQSAMISQPLSSHVPAYQLSEQHQSLEQPIIMQQQCTTPLAAASISQPVSTSASLTTSVELHDHQQHLGQRLSSSLPVTVSLDHSDRRQGQNTDISRPLSANLDQRTSQIPNNNQSLKDNNSGHNTHQDQRTSSSLYQDMLDLMQKRETELTLQVNAITADKERLQAEKTLLQRENNSSRETIPALQSQVSSLQVENQMLQLTVEKLNEELTNVQQQSLTPSQVSSSNESKLSDVTHTNNEGPIMSHDQPTLNSTITKIPNKQQRSLVADAHSLGLSDNNSSYSKNTDHRKSSLEENAILVKELERQQELIKEMQQDHKSELSKMNRKLQRAYHDRDSLIETLVDMEKKQKHLHNKLSLANETMTQQISLHEHQQSIKELQQMLDELMATHEAVTTAQADKLKSLKREKKSLTSKLAEAKNIIVELESQCTGLHKANRKLKEELDRLQENMEISRDRENFVHNELSKAILKAEKTAVERDTLAQLARSQQATTERAVEKRRKDKTTIKHLQRKLNQPQPATGEVLTADDIDYAYSTDQELARQQEHCQEAIKHIRLLERSKQEELRKSTGSVRNTERHLDKLWKAAVTPK